ncbi:hypothetical protein ACHAWF_016605 [Thalassiosira exigua]
MSGMDLLTPGADVSTHLQALSQFAEKLKIVQSMNIDDNDDGVESPVVMAFNHELLLLKCKSDSPQYAPDLSNFTELAAALFREGEIWKDRDLLYSVTKAIAGLEGWCVRLNGQSIQCNRYGVPNTKRDYHSGPLRSGCTWRISLSPLSRLKYKPQQKVDKENLEQQAQSKRGQQWQYKSDWSRPVKIATVVGKHGGDCCPGRMNRVDVMSRSGTYTRDMPEQVMFSLCNYYEKSGTLKSSVIKSTVEPVWPRNKVMTSQEAFNIRLKVMRLMPSYRNCNGDYMAFQQQMGQSDLVGFLDDEVDIDDDVAYQVAHDMWLEISTGVSNEEGIFTFIEYLKLIQSRAKGFVFKVATGNGSAKGKKRLLGVLWMTATMRRNFELFGGYICMDMMKRGINKLLWPYSAVTMYDETRKICLACEGFMCGERSDMYEFSARFLEQYAPGRSLSDVRIVSGDGFFSRKAIRDMGFANARLIADHWHLVDSGLEQIFGKYVYGMISSHLVRMIRSNSEKEFNEAYEAAVNLLAVSEFRSGEAEANLKEFADRRETYAFFELARIPGNRGLRGSSMAEQNHSSVLVHLNDGDKTANFYCGEPDELIRDLMKRQSRHVRLTNQRLHDNGMKLRIESSKLQAKPPIDHIVDLLKACRSLNLPTYERYKSRQKKAREEYTMREEGGMFFIQSVINPEAAPRTFLSLGHRCSCPSHLENEDMCAHEIVLHGGFKRDLFLPCHLHRQQVTGSLVGVENHQPTSIDTLIGYELEPVDNELQEYTIGDADAPTVVLNAPPVGYLEEASRRVTPLEKHAVTNILTAVAGAYGTFNQATRFEISTLALRLQELVQTKGRDSTIASKGDVELEVVKPSELCKETKKRAKSVKEKQADIQQKKVKQDLQMLGMSQILSRDGEEIVANAKVGSLPKCSFCAHPNHRCDYCPKRLQYKGAGSEYGLTTKKTSVERELISRIEESMPVLAEVPMDVQPWKTVHRSWLSKNLIIHECYLTPGCRPNALRSMVFNISLLGCNGEVEEGNAWVSGDVMHSMANHNMKKYKFVFDHTLTMKDGWVQRSQILTKRATGVVVNVRESV